MSIARMLLCNIHQHTGLSGLCRVQNEVDRDARGMRQNSHRLWHYRSDHEVEPQLLVIRTLTGKVLDTNPDISDARNNGIQRYGNELLRIRWAIIGSVGHVTFSEPVIRNHPAPAAHEQQDPQQHKVGRWKLDNVVEVDKINVGGQLRVIPLLFQQFPGLAYPFDSPRGAFVCNRLPAVCQCAETAATNMMNIRDCDIQRKAKPKRSKTAPAIIGGGD
jgi:hypothetical protein